MCVLNTFESQKQIQTYIFQSVCQPNKQSTTDWRRGLPPPALPLQGPGIRGLQPHQLLPRQLHCLGLLSHLWCLDVLKSQQHSALELGDFGLSPLTTPNFCRLFTSFQTLHTSLSRRAWGFHWDQQILLQQQGEIQSPFLIPLRAEVKRSVPGAQREMGLSREAHLLLLFTLQGGKSERLLGIQSSTV